MNKAAAGQPAAAFSFSVLLVYGAEVFIFNA